MLREHLAELAAGGAPGTALFLYGPRGNGKTVLLGWLEEKATASFPQLEVLFLTPSRVPDPVRLAEHIAPRSWLAGFRPGEVKDPRLRGAIAWGLDGGAQPPLEELIEARARNRPLLLILDEAHTLDPEVGHALLNAAQFLAGRHPFLLAPAGTPDLPKRLQAMNAPFWARGTRIRVGRLSEAAAAAVRVPLEERGVSIADELLQSLVDDCHGYPYFTQVWGDALWRQICDPASGVPRPRVTAADRDRARERFAGTRDIYSRMLFEEIADERLLPVARAIADAFVAARERHGGREAVLTCEQLDAAIERGLGESADTDRAFAARQRLDHLGFIWGTAHAPCWEPGIPSLIDYLRRYAPPVNSQADLPARI